MTAVVERILSDFDSLDAGEKLLVRDHVFAVTQTEQRRTITKLRGSGKGEHLLEKLLKDRAEDGVSACRTESVPTALHCPGLIG